MKTIKDHSLYLVISEECCMGRSALDIAEQAIAGGTAYDGAIAALAALPPAAVSVSIVCSAAPMPDPMSTTTRSASGAPTYSTSP